MKVNPNLSIRDLSKELSETPIRSNRIVERFLFHRVVDRDLNCGVNCAGDIHSYMKRESIPIPNDVSPKQWINRAIWDAARNGPSRYFMVVEIEGSRSGINFSWWYLNGKTKPEIVGYPPDVCDTGVSDNADTHVCKG